MAIMIDTTNLEDIAKAYDLGLVSGVTTNPALVAEAGRPGLDILRDVLVTASDGPVFYQVTKYTVEEREAEAREASAFAPGRVVIKIPATTENIGMTASLSQEGVLCALTAVSHAAQAYLGAEAGAAYVIPYVNRLTRQRGDGYAVVRRCRGVIQGTSARLLAASLKSADEVVETVLAGAQDLTIPPNLLFALGDHELTDEAIEKFDVAFQAVFG